MSSRRLGLRLSVALALCGLLLGMVGTPVMAAGTTRWVDDDSRRGDGPRACNSANFHSIQAAINASSPGDTVYVCPGTYDEQVTINVRNLHVQARPTHGARIVPPAELDLVDDSTALVRITKRDVDFVGFRIRVPSGEINPTAVTTSCEQVDAAIIADAPHSVIKSNSIRAVGDYSLSGECGYLSGIVLGSDVETSPAVAAGVLPEYDGDTSWVLDNIVRDFKLLGIGLAGERSARIQTNKIRYVHANDPATCLMTPVLGIQQSLTFPCAPLFESVSLIDEEFPFSVGIGVAGALADVRRNSVYSTFDVDLCYELECHVSLGVGIGLLGPAPGSRVRNNTVTNAAFAIGVINDTVILGALPTAPDGVQVTGNRTNEALIGLFVLGSNNVFYGNRAHLNRLGVLVLDGEDNLFDSNDFRFNLDQDCVDQSTGLMTLGTANDWDGLNLGHPDYSSPTGLCGIGIF